MNASVYKTAFVLPFLFAFFVAPTAQGAGFGEGESISFLAEIPSSSQAHDQYGDQYGPARFNSVGFKYAEYWFFIPVWTSDGEFVVYSGDRYITIGTDPETVAETLGVPKNVLVEPFFYRYPLGLVIMPVVLLVFVVIPALLGSWVHSWRIRRLLADPMYQEALEIALDPDAGINQAVDHLNARGVPTEKAQQQMELLLSPRARALAEASSETARHRSKREPPVRPVRHEEASPKPPRSASSSATSPQKITLVCQDGGQLSFGIKTVVGKSTVARFGADSTFWDSSQFTLERAESGWIVVPNAKAANETLLNGMAVVDPTELNDGDVVAVGRQSKGIAKLPLTVRMG